MPVEEITDIISRLSKECSNGEFVSCGLRTLFTYNDMSVDSWAMGTGSGLLAVLRCTCLATDLVNAISKNEDVSVVLVPQKPQNVIDELYQFNMTEEVRTAILEMTDRELSNIKGKMTFYVTYGENSQKYNVFQSGDEFAIEEVVDRNQTPPAEFFAGYAGDADMSILGIFYANEFSKVAD